MPRRKKLNDQEQRVLRAIHTLGGWRTAGEVADQAHVAWNTAHDHLVRFAKQNWLMWKKSGGRVYFKVPGPNDWL